MNEVRAAILVMLLAVASIGYIVAVLCFTVTGPNATSIVIISTLFAITVIANTGALLIFLLGD